MLPCRGFLTHIDFCVGLNKYICREINVVDTCSCMSVRLTYHNILLAARSTIKCLNQIYGSIIADSSNCIDVNTYINTKHSVIHLMDGKKVFMLYVYIFTTLL